MASLKVNKNPPKTYSISGKRTPKKPGHGDGTLLSDKIKKAIKKVDSSLIKR
ncbi:MAG: hypothetical protein ACI4N3_04125 [Alphaproteobacteria bacterium]